MNLILEQKTVLNGYKIYKKMKIQKNTYQPFQSINPYKLQLPSNIIICGVTNSQKTTIALNILRNNYKNFNRIIVATTIDEDYKKIRKNTIKSIKRKY